MRQTKSQKSLKGIELTSGGVFKLASTDEEGQELISDTIVGHQGA